MIYENHQNYSVDSYWRNHMLPYGQGCEEHKIEMSNILLFGNSFSILYKNIYLIATVYLSSSELEVSWKDLRSRSFNSEVWYTLEYS